LGENGSGRKPEVRFLRLLLNKDEDQGHRFYGRRQGRPLKPHRIRLVENLLPKLRVAAPDEKAPASLDPVSLFDAPKRAYWLEIGFGGGEHLAAMAANNPDVGIIGCEPFVNGVASLLSFVEEQNLQNVRIFDDDVRHLLPGFMDKTFERIFLLYPDPWHKKKHNRRRMVNDENVEIFARILKQDGEFRFASDIMGYIRWTLSHVASNKGFQWMAERPGDWRTRPDDMIQTRYEAKARRKGSECVYLRYRRT
jgi:tRNA (guanine-N7-)-methyltransferase